MHIVCVCVCMDVRAYMCASVCVCVRMCVCVCRSEVKERVVWVDTKKTQVKNKAGKLKEKEITVLEVGGHAGGPHLTLFGLIFYTHIEE